MARHPLRAEVEIPEVLANTLTQLGWFDITDTFVNGYPTALYASPDGRMGLFIDEDESVDEDGDHRPKYNLMACHAPQSDSPVRTWWHGWSNDIVYSDDVNDVLQALSE